MTGSGTSEPISVWVVEDDDRTRSYLRALIDREHDLSCPCTFPSGEDLFAYLNTHFAPEVVLMDLGLPGMSGIEAVSRLRKRHPASRIIILTVHEDNDRIFQALCNGASGYLTKSASPEAIVDAIRDVMQGGAAMSPPVARRVLNMFTQLEAERFDYGLTPRETEVLGELVKGKSKKRIASDLFVSMHTVDTHLRSVYLKLHVCTATEAVAKAVSERLV